jgi:hypothetical protein
MRVTELLERRDPPWPLDVMPENKESIMVKAEVSTVEKRVVKWQSSQVPPDPERVQALRESSKTWICSNVKGRKTKSIVKSLAVGMFLRTVTNGIEITWE